MVELVWIQDDAEAGMQAGESLVDLMAPMTFKVAFDGSFVAGSYGCFVGGSDGFDGFDGGSDGSEWWLRWLRWPRWWRRWIG